MKQWTFTAWFIILLALGTARICQSMAAEDPSSAVPPQSALSQPSQQPDGAVTVRGASSADLAVKETLSVGLFRMLFKFKVIQIEDNEYAVIIFALGCALIGILTVVADVAFYVLRGQSLLDIKHGAKNTPLVGIAWAVGALIIGYLGQVVNVFQVSLLACATVGITWPVIFTQVLEKTRRKEETQQPGEEAKS